MNKIQKIAGIIFLLSVVVYIILIGLVVIAVVGVEIGIILVLLLTYLGIFISGLIFEKSITNLHENKIKQMNKELLKVEIDDNKFYINLSYGVGIAFIIFGLAKIPSNNISMLLGLALLTLGNVLMYYVYTPNKALIKQIIKTEQSIKIGKIKK